MTLSRVSTMMAALLALLAGCVQIPNEELQSYAAASAEARLAGDLLLDEVAPFVEAEAAAPSESCDIDAQLGFRTCFSPSLALGPEAARRDEPPEIRLRRLALAMIADYNRMLIDVAAGAPTERRRAVFDSLARSAAGAAFLAPGGQGVALAVEGFSGPIGDVLERVGEIADGDLAVRSVLAARADIQDLIGALIDDSKALYAAFFLPIQQPAGLALIDISIAEDEGDQDAIDENRVKLAEYAERMKPFEAALVAYVRMLDQQSRSLDQLAEAIGRPTATPDAAFATVVRQATEARAISEQFLASMRALRGS